MNNKLTKFTTHSSLLTQLRALVTKCHLQKYNYSNYSGTHSLFAHLNCLRNFCSCAIGCLLSRAGFANAHTAPYRKFAFTLAETLIVMGIIGVVAALTLPNLNSSTGDKEKVAKVKKIYSNLQDAYGRAVAVYGPYDEWFINDSTAAAKSKRIGERITEFMKISKTCGASITGCFTATSTKGILNSSGCRVYGSYDGDGYTYITADGTSLGFRYVADSGFYVVFDIDGPNKGSYTLGVDYFIFYYDATQESGIDLGLLNNGSGPIRCAEPSDEEACFNWVIYHGNMDYRKINSTGKCPNGTTILDGTTNTTCN